MENIIKVKINYHYGRKNIYIISNHQYAINQLTGKRTIDENDIQSLKKLGFVFEIETEKI